MMFPRDQNAPWQGSGKERHDPKQNHAKEQDWREIFRSGGADGMRALVQQVVQEVLEAEMDEVVGAQKGERTETRLGYRSGSYTRTRVGKLILCVPQDRQGRYRKVWLAHVVSDR